MSVLKSKGVYSAIAKHLSENLGENDGVLELNCGTGEFGQYLHEQGVKNYHGIDDEVPAIQEAKKRVPKFKSRFHDKEGNYKRDIIVCLNGTPFETIPSGQRLIALTSGFPDYDAVCLAIGGLYKEGATTVQHDDLFITYGVRV